MFNKCLLSSKSLIAAALPHPVDHPLTYLLLLLLCECLCIIQPTVILYYITCDYLSGATVKVYVLLDAQL